MSLCANDRFEVYSSDLFSRVLFSLLPPLLAIALPALSRRLFALFFPSKSTLFCRARGAAQSSERGNFRMDLSTKFGKEIPSRNLPKKRSVIVLAMQITHDQVVKKQDMSYKIRLMLNQYSRASDRSMAPPLPVK